MGEKRERKIEQTGSEEAQSSLCIPISYIHSTQKANKRSARTQREGWDGKAKETLSNDDKSEMRK